MKKIILLLITFGIFTQIQAQDLLYIPFEDIIEKGSYENNPEHIVHFFGEDFLITSGDVSTSEKAVLLDSNPWSSEYQYSIVYINPEDKSTYISTIPASTTICYTSDDYLILKHLPELIFPAHNDGCTRITQSRAHLAKGKKELYQIAEKSDPNPFVQSLIAEIDMELIEETIQHLENFGTRFYNMPEAFESEQWIKEQFEALGLEAEIHTFPQPGSSGNIIAIQPGTLYPDEYIVCGAHYDTYNTDQNFDDAPGADDNATGVASIIEAARILTQYELERSVIYCAWAAEEIGLIGSQYYAEDAAAEEMNIIGYFNLDMTGYLDPSQNFKFVLHYSHNSELLRDYYIDIASTYYPGIPIEMSFSSWGSDYASFANNGYMGVSQNEDWSHANPHYHSPTDLIGPSVNNFEQVETYAGLNLASVLSLANSIAFIPFPPTNLTGQKGDQEATLSWEFVEDDIQSYGLYRDGELIENIDPFQNSYTDTGLENETIYTYYVTAKYNEDTESEPSNEVELVPLAPIFYPFFTDFEDLKALYWDFSEGWGLASNASFSPSHSLTDTPIGFYENNSQTICSLDPIHLSGGGSDCFMEFHIMHLLNESGDGDHVYLEMHGENQEEWTILETFSGTQSQWMLKQYSLQQYYDQTLYIRFRMVTDQSGQDFGFFLDDFTLDYHTTIPEAGKNTISVFPNPTSQVLNIKNMMTNSSAYIVNSLGQRLMEQRLDKDRNQIDISSLKNGLYYIHITDGCQETQVFKFVKK